MLNHRKRPVYKISLLWPWRWWGCNHSQRCDPAVPYHLPNIPHNDDLDHGIDPKTPLTLVCIYHPSECSAKIGPLLLMLLKSLFDGSHLCVLVGALHTRHLNWKSLSSNALSSSVDAQLDDLIQDYFMLRHVWVSICPAHHMSVRLLLEPTV